MTVQQNKRLDEILAAKSEVKQSPSTMTQMSDDHVFLKQQEKNIMKVNDQYCSRDWYYGDVSALKSLRLEPVSDAKISAADLIDFAVEHQKALIQFKEQTIPALMEERTNILKTHGEKLISFGMSQYEYNQPSDSFFQPLVQEVNNSIQELENIITAVKQRFPEQKPTIV
jgi:hypothetical protein